MTTRLTSRQILDRDVLEDDLLANVTELAEQLEWGWVHFRPGMTTKGWRTPVSGPLGKGWVDLVEPEQIGVIGELADLRTDRWDCASHGRSTDPKPQMPRCPDCVPLVQVFVWRPSDWSSGAIEGVLR